MIPHSCNRSDSIPSLLVLEVVSQVVPPQLVEHRPFGRDSKMQPKVCNVVTDVPEEAPPIYGHKGCVGEYERERSDHCHREKDTEGGWEHEAVSILGVFVMASMEQVVQSVHPVGAG